MKKQSLLFSLLSLCCCLWSTPSTAQCNVSAFFQASTDTICVGDTALFINDSDNASFFIWYINGDDVSTDVDFLTVFNAPGIYNIGLDAMDSTTNCIDEYGTTIEVIDCGNGSSNCIISNVHAEAHPCDSAGLVWVDIEFEVSNPESAQFEIVGNGQHYGTFFYGQTFYTFGPIEGNGNVYEFIVRDLEQPNCSNFTEMTAPNCNAGGICSIRDLIVEPHACHTDGTYHVDMAFNHDNTGGVGVDIFANGQFQSFQTTYPEPNGFITIENFGIGNGDTICVSVSDNDNPNCVADYCFIAPNCGNTGECDVTTIEAHVVDDNCDSLVLQGGFYVEFSFSIVNPGNQGYRVRGNGTIYGDFFYSDDHGANTTYTHHFGPLEPNGQVYEFIVIDLENDNCATFTVVTAPDCSNTAVCSIRDLIVEPHACDANGSYAVDLAFIHENTNGVAFDVFVNGEFHSFQTNYPEPNGFVTIENFGIGNGDTTCVFIHDNDNPNCGTDYCFIAPNCANTMACSIRDLIVEPHDCNTDGTFNIDISFIHENANGAGFDLFIDSSFHQYFPEYPAPNGFITLENVAIGEGQEMIIVVSDNDNPNCGTATSLIAPNCSGECQIEASFEVDFLDQLCPGDSIFVENHSFGADHFIWTINNDIASHDEHLFWVVPAAGEYVVQLYVRSANHPDCEDELAISFVVEEEGNCGMTNNCEIIADFFAIDSLSCEGDAVEFFNNATGADQFNWWINGDLVSQTVNLTYTFQQTGIYEIGLDALNSDHPNCFDEVVQVIEILPAAECGNAPTCQVEADFSVAHTPNGAICAGSMVAFENLSSGANTFVWLVNGEVQGDGFDFSYTFPETGVYTIGLIAENDDFNNCISDFSIDIEAEDPAVCNSNACTDSTDCVLPGDADNNGLVNALDLLRIGEAYHNQGPSRPSPTTDYFLQLGDSWHTYFSDGVDYKHADTNGDGVIDENDVAAIQQNYSAVPTIEQASTTSQTNTNNQNGTNNIRLRPALIDEYENADGEMVYDFGIILENEGNNPIVQDVYGLAFAVNYTAPINIEASVQYATPNGTWHSWLGDPNASELNQKLITIDRSFAEQGNGQIEIAMSRVDQQALDGTGLICRILCVADISATNGRQSSNNSSSLLNISIQNANVITNNGNANSVQGSAVNAPLSIPPITIPLTVLLEGAYDATNQLMTTTVANQSDFPLQQPFNTAPWNYNGGESIVSLPSGAVDWVLVEARAANNPAQIMEQKAALVLANGNVVDINGVTNGVNFFGLAQNTNYYISIRQRNHLAIMSANPVDLSSSLSYDFTNPTNVRGGAKQLSLVDAGNAKYALSAGDFNGDGVITVSDFNQFQQALQANSNGNYLLNDVDFNGVLSVDDFNVYRNNASKIGVTTIRY